MGKRWRLPKCPLMDILKTCGIIHIRHGILLSLNRKEIPTHAVTWMNLKDIMLSEISQSQKVKYYMTPLYEVLE